MKAAKCSLSDELILNLKLGNFKSCLAAKNKVHPVMALAVIVVFPFLTRG